MRPLDHYRDNIEAATRRLKRWTAALAAITAELPDAYDVSTAPAAGSAHGDPRLISIAARIGDVIESFEALTLAVGLPKRERLQHLRGPQS
jgi:hypothetical protein